MVGRWICQEGVWLEGFLYLEGYTHDRLVGEKGHGFHRKELYGLQGLKSLRRIWPGLPFLLLFKYVFDISHGVGSKITNPSVTYWVANIMDTPWSSSDLHDVTREPLFQEYILILSQLLDPSDCR